MERVIERDNGSFVDDVRGGKEKERRGDVNGEEKREDPLGVGPRETVRKERRTGAQEVLPWEIPGIIVCVSHQRAARSSADGADGPIHEQRA
jgi:hypothetical protein